MIWNESLGNVMADKLSRIWIFCVAYFVGVILTIMYSFINFYPHLPSSLISWILLALAGPPVYLLRVWISGKIFSEKRGRDLSEKDFSMKRILYALVLAVPLFGLLWLIYFIIAGT